MIKNSTLPQDINWHILGAGSLGCLWAAYLLRADKQCTLILKDDEQLQALQAKKAIILEKNDCMQHYGVDAMTIEQVAEQTATQKTTLGHLLLSTKAEHCLGALKTIGHAINHQTIIVLMQNGMGLQQHIAEQYPQAVIYCAVTTEGANCPQPFHVVHAGKGQTQIGLLNKDQGIQGPESILQLLPQQELSITYNPDILQALWQKLAVNCAINGLTAIFQCRNGELEQISEARQHISILCEEIKAVMNALGLSRQAENLEQQVLEVIRSTAKNRSSMLQDISKRRKTEILYINGFLCEQAVEQGIEVPANKKILQNILDLEQQLHCK